MEFLSTSSIFIYFKFLNDEASIAISYTFSLNIVLAVFHKFGQQIVSFSFVLDIYHLNFAFLINPRVNLKDFFSQVVKIGFCFII